MAEVQSLRNWRRLERFTTDVDPENEIACVALLRRRAIELTEAKNGP